MAERKRCWFVALKQCDRGSVYVSMHSFARGFDNNQLKGEDLRYNSVGMVTM